MFRVDVQWVCADANGFREAMTEGGGSAGPGQDREEACEKARQIVVEEGMAELEAEVMSLEEREEQLAEREGRLCRTFYVYGLLRRELQEAGLLRQYLEDERERLPGLTLDDLFEVNVLKLFVEHGVTTLGWLSVWSPFTERYPFPGQVLSAATEAMLGLSEEALALHDFPTERSEYEDFGVQVDADTTWRGAERMVSEKWQRYRQEWAEISEKWNGASRRLRGYRKVLNDVNGSEAGDRDGAAERATGKAHEHVLEIGEALCEERRETGSFPWFGGKKTEFKKWAGKQISLSGSTAYEAIRAANCWVRSRQGRPDEEALEKTLRRVVEYAKQHSTKLRTSEN